MLAHSAYHQAEIAARCAMGETARADESMMPRCIYTLPQLAAVGPTAEALKAGGHSVMTGRFPMRANGRAVCGGETVGEVIVHADETTGRVLSASILCEQASEMIGAVLSAICMRATVDDFRRMIFPHPSRIEAVREAALDVCGETIHRAGKPR